MSTSPSWFDQEKFSRLVKKVGPKTITEILPSNLGLVPENRPHHQGLASTARISLVSKPSNLLADHRSLPALPRRTGPLPSVRSLYPPAPQPTPLQPVAPSPVEPARDEPAHPSPVEAATRSEREQAELTEIWHKMNLLNEELARTTLDRDQALHDIANLRELMRRSAETRGEKNDSSAVEELANLTKERDDATAQVEGLRVQLLQARDAEREKEAAASGQTQEKTVLTQERDQARREYAELRADFEKLKAEQAPKEETVKYRKEWEQQLEELKRKLEERDKEIVALKAGAETAGGADEKFKQEIASLRQQLTKLKDEASIAQRGLALSQMALQQTRDTLREATEGTSMSRHNFDHLKSECALLAQQNTVLQAQVDQLTREVNASKAKITTRLQ